MFFEPGPWQPPGTVTVLAEVPAPSRAHMATPAGLLLHELSNAPAPLVDAAEEILALSLELDTGRHDAPCSAGLLYAVRLMTRMHSFIRFLLTESGWGDEVDAQTQPAAAAGSQSADATEGDEGEQEEPGDDDDEDDDVNEGGGGTEQKAADNTAAAEGDDGEEAADGEKSKTTMKKTKKGKKKANLSPSLTQHERVRGPGGWAGGSGARGVRCPPPPPVLSPRRRLRAALDDRVRPTLRRWLAAAVKSGATKSACMLHSHLAYLHWSTPAEVLNRRAARTLLTAQAYILVNHPFQDAAEGSGSKMRSKGWQDAGGVDEALGFAPTELFDLFQRQRRALLAWMESNPELADGVLEEVVRVLTLNSTGTDDEEEDVVEEVERKGWGKIGKGVGKLNGWFGKLKNKKNSKDQEARTTTTAAAAETSAADTGATNDDGGDGGVAARESVGGEGEDKGKDKDKAAASTGVAGAAAKDKSTTADRRWVQVPGPGGAGRFIPETKRRRRRLPRV